MRWSVATWVFTSSLLSHSPSPLPLPGALLLALSALLLGLASSTQAWSTSSVAKGLSAGSLGLFRYCTEVGYRGVGEDCGPLKEPLFHSLGAKNAPKLVRLLTATRALTGVALVTAVLGSAWDGGLAASPFTLRSRSVPSLLFALTSFVASLLALIFWGSVHRGVKGGEMAGTFFPHTSLGPSWRTALVACIASGLAIPAAIVDLSLPTHKQGWAEARAGGQTATHGKGGGKGGGQAGTSGHYATVVQEAGVATKSE